MLKIQFCFLLFIFSIGCSQLPTTTPTDNDVAGIPFRGFPILQGHTTDTSAQFTIVAPKNKIISYFIRSENPASKLQFRNFEVNRFEKSFSSWAVDRISIQALNPNETYQLEVRSQFNELLDIREFTTLNITKPQLRFAAVSCANDQMLEFQQQIWNELAAKGPQVLFMLGDNAYVTTPIPIVGAVTPEQIWKRYVETRLRLQIYRAPKLIPTYAIWDDNDYGQNDGDENYKYKNESAEIFSQFFGLEIDSVNLQSGPGISHALRLAGQQFLLMDDRSFRTPNLKDNDSQTHWGKSQERWMLEEIKTGTPTWVLNGDQIFGGYHRFESLEGSHPKHFDRLIKSLSQISTPVFFLSGDRHLTETMVIKDKVRQFSSFEITSSAIHSTMYHSDWNKKPNPRQLDGVELKPNYILINSTARNGNFSIQATSYSLNNQILFHRYFEVKKGLGIGRLNTK